MALTWDVFLWHGAKSIGQRVNSSQPIWHGAWRRGQSAEGRVQIGKSMAQRACTAPPLGLHRYDPYKYMILQ